MHVRAAAGPVRLGELKLVLLAAGALLLTALPLHAQQPDTIRIDSLVVDATRAGDAARAPLAITTVGRARIQERRAGIGLDEALTGVPGLLINNRHNFALGSRIVMRGLGARAAFGVRGVRVVADGIPLTMPDGQSNLNNLDLGAAGSIHVLRGPASSLYGNAAGGVLVIESERAPRTPSLDARVLAGSQGTDAVANVARAQVKAGGMAAGIDYLLSVSHLESDGYRAHSAARQTLLNTRIGRELDAASRLALTLSLVDAPRAQNPGSLPLDSMRRDPQMAWPRNVATGSGEAVRQAQAGLRYTRTGRTRADASVYGLHRTLDNPLPFAVIELDRDAAGARAAIARGILTLGADAELMRDERREYDNNGGRPIGVPRRDQVDRVASVGPFAQLRVTRGAAAFTVGGRFDAVRFEVEDRLGTSSGERTLSAPSGMAGVTYALRSAVLFANAASAFQTPTTTELLNAPPAPGEPCCPSGFNRELEPQRAVSLEAGARGTTRRMSWDVALYHMTVSDALVPFQVAGVEGRDFFRNAGRTRHRGVELALAGDVADGVSVEAAYTLTDVHFLDDGGDGAHDGNRVPGIPPHRLSGAVQLHRGSSSVRLEAQHHAAQQANDANTARADAWTLLDVRAQTSLELGALQLAPFIAVENLLDESYAASVTVNAAAARFYEPGPGRSLLLGASVRTGGWRR